MEKILDANIFKHTSGHLHQKRLECSRESRNATGVKRTPTALVTLKSIYCDGNTYSVPE